MSNNNIDVHATLVLNGVVVVSGGGFLPPGITPLQFTYRTTPEDVVRGHITLVLIIIPAPPCAQIVTTWVAPYVPAPPAPAGEVVAPVAGRMSFRLGDQVLF